jgi:ribosomal protein S18 acetylase RimI-like enzyme
VYVVPERRGTGVYSAMYRHLQAEAKRAGEVRAVRLYVETSNGDALRAYRGHGMKEAPYGVYEWVVA